MAETVVSGKEIATSNRLFIELKSYGNCDAKGRTVLGIGLKGKARANADAPFRTLIIPLIADLLSLCKYSTTEERDADLAAFYEFATNVGAKEPTP